MPLSKPTPPILSISLLDQNPPLHANYKDSYFCLSPPCGQNLFYGFWSMDSGTKTLSVDQVNVKNLVQFHNQANPGSNKYLF